MIQEEGSVICEELVSGVELEDSLDEMMDESVELPGIFPRPGESFEAVEDVKRELSNLREIIKMLRMMDK